MAEHQDPAVVPLSEQEEGLLRAWYPASLRLIRALDADLVSEQGMSLSEYAALMHLSEAPGRTLTMGELASASSLSLSGMSRAVDRLQGQGLVERERCATDRRSLNVILTDAGLNRLRAAWPTHLASVRRHMMCHLQGIDLPKLTAAVSHFAAETHATKGLTHQ